MGGEGKRSACGSPTERTEALLAQPPDISETFVREVDENLRRVDLRPPKAVIARLEPLARPGEPWFGTAGEMTALAMIKQGRKQEAGQLFVAIANDKGVPQTIRARAVQVAGSLGIDASAALQ